MRFKRKKDNVKAIHATLQELQGIDPLDYLAKYCIIDQNKVPHYQRCFDNVDRDEDDEIDIGELDFALKAVNYDLISDSEMSYVHSVSSISSAIHGATVNVHHSSLGTGASWEIQAKL